MRKEPCQSFEEMDWVARGVRRDWNAKSGTGKAIKRRMNKRSRKQAKAELQQTEKEVQNGSGM